MSEPTLSREMALRIGLAARILECPPAQVLEVLIETVGLPPGEEPLAALTAKQFRKASDGLFAETEGQLIKDAIALLQGKGDPLTEAPPVEPYVDGDLPGSIRVACASNGAEQLDGHFGSCSQFLVYQVSAAQARLIAVRNTRTPGEGEEKNEFRAELIRDCQLLVVQSIGGPAAAKVVKRGVHPVKHPGGGPARDYLAGLQASLAGTPPPWLALVMGQEPSTKRFLAEAEA